MAPESLKSDRLLGLDLLAGSDSFLKDLVPEEEAAISGGGRWRSRSGPSGPSRPSRLSGPSGPSRSGRWSRKGRKGRKNRLARR